MPDLWLGCPRRIFGDILSIAQLIFQKNTKFYFEFSHDRNAIFVAFEALVWIFVAVDRL